jgi:predicted dehydrogenase
VFSRDPAHAAAVAAICKAQPCTDAAQLIQRADIDAIDVCLPSASHPDVVVPALEAPARPVPVAERNPYEVELQRFVDCLRGRADPALLDVDRAIEALRLSIATTRSFTSA